MAAARPPQTTCTVCRDSLTTLVPEPTLIIIRIREYNQMLYPWRAEVRHNFDITLGLKVRVAGCWQLARQAGPSLTLACVLTRKWSVCDDCGSEGMWGNVREAQNINNQPRPHPANQRWESNGGGWDPNKTLQPNGPQISCAWSLVMIQPNTHQQ